MLSTSGALKSLPPGKTVVFRMTCGFWQDLMELSEQKQGGLLDHQSKQYYVWIHSGFIRIPKTDEGLSTGA